MGVFIEIVYNNDWIKAEIVSVWNNGSCFIEFDDNASLGLIELILHEKNNKDQWRWIPGQEPKEIEFYNSFFQNWIKMTNITWDGNYPIVGNGSPKMSWRPILINTVVSNQELWVKEGRCPQCGNGGDWIAMALICQNGHGKFLG